MEGITTIRQAYLAVGIIKKAPPKKKKSPDLETVTGVDIVTRVKQLRAFRATEFEKLDVETLEEPVRQALGKEIAALITELTKLKERLDGAKAK